MNVFKASKQTEATFQKLRRKIYSEGEWKEQVIWNLKVLGIIFFLDSLAWLHRYLAIVARAEYHLRGKSHLRYMIAGPSLSIELMLDNKIML